MRFISFQEGVGDFMLCPQAYAQTSHTRAYRARASQRTKPIMVSCRSAKFPPKTPLRT
jgi:hypothetical protein